MFGPKLSRVGVYVLLLLVMLTSMILMVWNTRTLDIPAIPELARRGGVHRAILVVTSRLHFHTKSQCDDEHFQNFTLSPLSVHSRFATPWTIDNFVFVDGLKFASINGIVPQSLIKKSEAVFFEYFQEFYFFKPVHTPEKRLMLSQTVHAFFEMCSKTKLSYFVCGDTLLGVYRHQGLIPWTGSAHVCMQESDWMTIQHTLSRVPGFHLDVRQNDQWRFSQISSKYSRKTIPYLEISFYAEDELYIWLINPSPWKNFLYTKSDMLPFKRNPFHEISASVPNNTEVILNKYFGNFTDECRSDNLLVQSYATSEPYNIYVSMTCQLLHPVYPFVFRESFAGITSETIKIGDIVRSITVKRHK